MAATRPVDTREVPEGYHLTAVPESTLSSSLEWRLEAGRPCRAGASAYTTACGQPSVAAMNRGRRGREAWWAYCGDHLYGRWIEDGQVMCWILEADAPELTPGGDQ